MKTNIKSLLLMMCIAVSCQSTESIEETDGGGGDQIRLSQQTATFDVSGGVQEISTQGEAWSMSAFVDSKDHTYLQLILSSNRIDSTVYSYEGISVQKIGLNRLKIAVSENNTKKEKDVSLELDAGNYFGHLRIIQQAK